MSGLRAVVGGALPWSPTPEPSAPARQRRSDDRPELVVVPAGRSRVGVGLVVALAVVALFASLLGLAVFHTMLVERQSDLDVLDARIVAAEQRVEELRVGITEGEAPERVLAEAERLGMVPAGDVVVLDATEVRSAG